MDNRRPAPDYMLKEWLSEGAATDSTWLHVSCARRISDKQKQRREQMTLRGTAPPPPVNGGRRTADTAGERMPEISRLAAALSPVSPSAPLEKVWN